MSKHTKVEVIELAPDFYRIDEVDPHPYHLGVASVISHTMGNPVPRLKQLANANLIADAFNVANETNMLPRELQKSHAELLEALRSVVLRLDYLYQSGRVDVNKLETHNDILIGGQAIKNATR